MYGDFPAKNTVHALYVYGSGRPCVFVLKALTVGHCICHRSIDAGAYTERGPLGMMLALLIHIADFQQQHSALQKGRLPLYKLHLLGNLTHTDMCRHGSTHTQTHRNTHRHTQTCDMRRHGSTHRHTDTHTQRHTQTCVDTVTQARNNRRTHARTH